MCAMLNGKKWEWCQRVTVIEDIAEDSQYIFFDEDAIEYISKNVFSDSPYGFSPIETAWDYINTLTSTFNYSSTIASGALPKYLLDIPDIQEKTLRQYREYFKNECMGKPNLPIVSSAKGNIKAEQIAPISEEATFMQYQQFTMAVIAMAFGVPPEKLAIAKSNDRSTVAEINSNLLSDCVKPYAIAIEDGINHAMRVHGITDTFHFIFAETLAEQQTRQGMILDLFQQNAITHTQLLEMLGIAPNPKDRFKGLYYIEMQSQLSNTDTNNGNTDNLSQPATVPNPENDPPTKKHSKRKKETN